MPLVKQRGFKFSILCDVFLLTFLTSISILINVALSVPAATTIPAPSAHAAKTTSKLTISSQVLSSNETDDQNNETNSTVVQTKELPIQYAELESLKTLSKRFDIYSDFSKIPFDTIHRILRDEEPEYRGDDQRIHRRWKKSTSTEGSVHHGIGKRSPPSLTDQSIEFSPLNYNNTNNNNINNDTSSDHSTKSINLGNNKQFSVDTIIRILLNQSSTHGEQIEKLNLTKCNLSDYSILHTEQLVNLKYLDLSDNNIKEFHLTNSTVNLQILNLSGNQVSNFTISSFTHPSSPFKLKELNLSKNNLSTVNHLNVSMLNELENLDLSCNKIHSLDKNYFFGQAKNLKILNLSGNQLNGILKETFYNLVNIDTLILSNNNISCIDLDTFLVLPNLQYLDLSNNNIQGRTIRALQGIPDLVGLSIANNPKLGDSLQEFVASWSLKELDISGTGLCQIPAALAQSVRSLKLMNNWLEIIRCGDLDSYPLLQYLDMSYSHIDDIEDDALGRLEILETLFLDHNNLNRIPISLPISLENLFLQNNQIMDIQPQTFQSLINLKVLDLSYNKIMYLPGLPLPKLLTLNLQSCELRGLSQSVVKTSPKLRDLLLDGNPIKCTDLLGIAEWASPCQNDRILGPPKDIKRYFQNMHNYFQYFKRGQEKLSKDNCCGNCKSNHLEKPICADSSKTKKRLSQINRIESQLQKYGTDDDDNVDDDPKRSVHPQRKGFLKNSTEKQTTTVQKENTNHPTTNYPTSQPTEHLNSTQRVKAAAIDKGKQDEKLYDNQSGSLFMTDASSANNPNISSFSTSKNTAVPNEHETNIKTLEKLFSGTSTNKEHNNNNNNNNNTNILVDAKIPILSLLYNSSESFIGNVSHGRITSKNIEQLEKQGTQNRLISDIKSDNNYVETSVLFESVRSQKRNQNEFHQADTAASSMSKGKDDYNKKLEAQKIIEGKKPSKSIETLPENNIPNEKFPKNTTKLNSGGSSGSDTNKTVRPIDEGRIDMSVAINSSQTINENRSYPEAATQIKQTLLTLSQDQEPPVNDQSLSDDVSSKLKSTARIMAPTFKTLSNRKLFKNKRIQTANITMVERKVNFPEMKSNLQENNTRKTISSELYQASHITDSFPTTTTTTDSPSIVPFESFTTIAKTTKVTSTIPSKVNKADKVVFFDQPLAIKGNDIITQNQNVSHLLGQDYRQTETVKQEVLSTNSHHQSQKQQLNQQNDNEWVGIEIKKQHQEEQPKPTMQKLLNFGLPSIPVNNNSRGSSFQRERYHLNGSQQEMLNNQPTRIPGIQDKRQTEFDGMMKDNSIVTTPKGIVIYGTINSDNSLSQSTKQNATSASLGRLKKLQISSPAMKTNSTTSKLKRTRNKQTRKKFNDLKNQNKVQAIILENSPLMKSGSDSSSSSTSEENILPNNILKTSKSSAAITESEVKMVTPGKYSSQVHHYLNTPKDSSQSNNLNFMNDQITASLANHIKDDIYDPDKLTTHHSLNHHTVNTAILPFTIDDYTFEKSKNGEAYTHHSLEKELPPVKVVKLHPSHDILSSYFNDEPSLEDSSSFKHEKKTTEMENYSKKRNHTSFSGNEKNSSNRKTLFLDEGNVFRDSTLNQTRTTEVFSVTSVNPGTIHNSSLLSNGTVPNNNSSNIGGSGDSGLPPEHWLDIRKATGHPGLFIVIGVTFGILLTLGLIHMYRCRRPWHYYHSRHEQHPLNHHNLSHLHHHPHHLHHHNNRHKGNQYGRPQTLTTASDDYNNCHCDEDDYYIEADHESQSSIKRNFLPMELLSTSSTSTSNNTATNGRCGLTARDNQGSNQIRKNSNTHHLDIW